MKEILSFQPRKTVDGELPGGTHEVLLRMINPWFLPPTEEGL
jgi:hypothetical protein